MLVPDRMLRLGPDDPAAVTWLWERWGTTWALRGVEELSGEAEPSPEGRTRLRYRFWSADWTPWRAIAAVPARWPSPVIDVRLLVVAE